MSNSKYLCNESMAAEVLIDKTDVSRSSSQTSSLVTFPSSANREASRHSDVMYKSGKNNSCRDLSSRFKSPAHSKNSIETEITSSKMMSRTNRRMRRCLKDPEFPLADVSTDKSTASQAVAFVIRASRRGVVPLCAEVADLLKEKARLEQEVEDQKEEIVKLMQNQMMPRSPSPPPPIMVDFGMQTLQDMHCQTISLQDAEVQTENMVLPCAQVKSLDENEKFSVKATAISGVKFQCGKDYTVQCMCPKMMTSSTQNPVLVSAGTNTENVKKLHSELGYYEHHRLEQRHRNLEMKHKDLKTETKEKTSKNNKLESDLTKAKEEIVSLQKSIQDSQAKEYERIQEEERLKMEETYSVDVHNDSESSIDDSNNKNAREDRRINVVITDGKKEVLSIDALDRPRSMRSSIFPGPILGCKCQMCSAFFRSSGLLGFACTPYVTDSSGRNPVLKDLRKLVSLQNSKLQVHPNDNVLLKNSKIGTVRYVGHLDGTGTPSIVYVGIELESPDGKHDGYLFGRRYFFAPQNHGIFLPLQDVLCIINKKLALPMTRQRHPAIASKKSTTPSTDGQTQQRRQRRTKKSSSIISTTSGTSDDRLPSLTAR